MHQIKIIKLSEQPQLKEIAANWFHRKWDIPAESYLESINESLNGRKPVPQWYLALEDGEIVGGTGVIENDFHNRRDLSPNVCALYVCKNYRGQGIAKKLLETVCSDMFERGIDTLYLITDHTAFYERCGWEFFCMVQGDGDLFMSRMYRRITTSATSET